jgi:hypothetical protein
MDDLLRVDLYCEDSGHELFVRALLVRIARALGVRVTVQPMNSRGGHGRALSEFRIWQKAMAKSGAGLTRPDLLALIIDANCHGWSDLRRDLSGEIDKKLFPVHVIGCPDPHVERWCFADPVAIQTVFGRPCPRDPEKCERDRYKRLLRETIQQSGQPILTTEMEVAPDLVDAMDLFAAGRNQPSLRHFVDDIRKALTRFLTEDS